MRIIEKAVQSNLEPTTQNVLWVDTSDPSNPVVKIYLNGKWEVSSAGQEDGSLWEKGSGINSVQQKGTGATAGGANSVAEGGDNIQGQTTPDTGSELLYARAEGYASHAEGAAHAIGKYSHAEGGGDSIQEGYKTVPTAEGSYSHAEGTHTYAKGSRSHAEGYKSKATGESSHAEGNNTEASGESSHAEGIVTIANGPGAHAEGDSTMAKGRCSHAEGRMSLANNNYEHAEGVFNKSNTGSTSAGNTQHSVGIGTSTNDRKNAFEIMQNGDAYLYGVGGYDGTNATAGTSSTLQQCLGKIGNLTEITWSELKTLRDSSGLTPGMQYRITDYNTTTVQADTQAAGHQFDIIVVADDNHTLNENARAIRHSGDTYFSISALEAWELKYDIDNDTTKYAWADATNGRGVIYYMKDEWNNECPYDFKNIQFKRYAVTDVTSTKLTSDALNNLKNILIKNSNSGLYFATKDNYGNFVPSDGDGVSYEINENDYNWYYTFQGIGSGDGSTINKMYDLTVETFKLTDECISFLQDNDSGADTEDYCRENKIEQFNQEFFSDDLYYKGRQVLNNIVFIGGLNYCYYNEDDEDDKYWEYNTSQIFGNRFGVNCNSNTFGDNCFSNTFGNSCGSNTFGNNFSSNTFGNNCGSNTFGNNFSSNTFGNNCRSNTFGNSCGSNTFGNSCFSNTFGNNFSSNTFGDNCFSNTFGNDCRSNTFGNSCRSNTFSNSCGSNTFGNNFSSNTFGNSCFSNTFGESVQYFITGNATGATTSAQTNDYIQYLIVENGVQNVNAYCTGTTSSSNCCQNIKIGLGVKGTSSSNRLQIDITPQIGATTSVTYQPANSQIINI